MGPASLTAQHVETYAQNMGFLSLKILFSLVQTSRQLNTMIFILSRNKLSLRQRFLKRKNGRGCSGTLGSEHHIPSQ